MSTWTMFKIIVVFTIYICNLVFNGTPILEAVPKLNACIGFLIWLIDFIYPNIESYVAQLSPVEAEILADLLEVLRDRIREFAAILPSGHWLISIIYSLSGSLTYVIEHLRRRG